MNWFGFGFNGFGQIKREDEHVTNFRVLSPVPLASSCVCAQKRKCLSSGEKIETEKVVASWSRSVFVHRSGEHRCVCVHGAGSSVMMLTESEGCDDALVSENCLILRFSNFVQCWSLHTNATELVWSDELKPAEKTENAVSLPLVPGGYIASKPPFFRALSLQLQAMSLALGTGHAVLLTVSGTVYTWGHGSHGQLGHGTLVSEDEPRAVEALCGVPMKSVAAGGWHSACISAGGDLYVWGWNESGQIGLPSKSLREASQKKEERFENNKPNKVGDKKDGEDITNVFISIQAFPALVDVSEMSQINKVSCGSRHTAAITSAGELYTWGWGLYGQLGHGTRCSLDEPKIVEFFSAGGLKVEDVNCGLWNTFVAAVPKEHVPS